MNVAQLVVIVAAALAIAGGLLRLGQRVGELGEALTNAISRLEELTDRVEALLPPDRSDRSHLRAREGGRR